MFRRKSKIPAAPAGMYQVVSSTVTKPIRPQRSRGIAIAIIGLIIAGAVTVSAVLIYKQHESHHVNVEEQPKSDRVIQSPQENANGSVTPRSSVNNGPISQPSAQ